MIIVAAIASVMVLVGGGRRFLGLDLVIVAAIWIFLITHRH